MRAMLTISGQLDHTTSRKAGPKDDPSRQWDETTMVVKDFGVTHYVKVGRDFGPVPADGSHLVIEVAVRAYPKKAGDGAGFEYIATRLRDSEAPASTTASAAS